MRSVFMMTDIEGVAGVVSFADQAFADGRYYDLAKRLLTAEAIAAVEGLLAVGVEEVLVCDGHGAGEDLVEDLHPAAKLLHGRPPLPNSLRPCPAMMPWMIIGQHAMAGVATSNQNHTQQARP